MESPDASAHGKLREVPTEPGYFGADRFRQEAEYFEGLMAFLAKPQNPELYAQF